MKYVYFLGIGILSGVQHTWAGNMSSSEMKTQLSPISVSATPNFQLFPYSLTQHWGANDRLEDVLQQNNIYPDTLNGNLSTSMTIRGFNVNKTYIDGLPDIQRLFTRDMLTVDKIEVIHGVDSLHHGLGAATGYINMHSIKPQPTASQSYGVQWSDTGLIRSTIDINDHLFGTDNLLYRIGAAWQQGEQRLADQPQDRHHLMFGLQWQPQNLGTWLLQAEHQKNQRPFMFGTAYLNQQIQYDQMLGDMQQPTQRVYDRYALHWNKNIGEWSIQLQAAHANVKRNEHLLGHWDIKDDQTLVGYYTQYRDDYQQNDLRMVLQQRHIWSENLVQHNTFSAESHRQSIDFTGTQNIAGFQFNAFYPEFEKIDIDSLRQTARYNSERYQDRSLALNTELAWQQRYYLQTGLRYIDYKIDNARKVNLARTRVAEDDAFVPHLGLKWVFHPKWTMYSHYAQAMEANRGQLKAGGYPKAQQFNQYEYGLVWQPQPFWLVQVAHFDIKQKNLTQTDPTDRNYVINKGQQQSQGWQLYSTWQHHDLNINLNAQHIKTEDRKGEPFYHIPQNTASLQFKYQLPIDQKQWQLWSSIQTASSRRITGTDGFKIPAYHVENIGLKWQPHTSPFSVDLAVYNLSDQHYLTSVNSASDMYQAPRRQAWLSFGLKY